MSRPWERDGVSAKNCRASTMLSPRSTGAGGALLGTAFLVGILLFANVTPAASTSRSAPDPGVARIVPLASAHYSLTFTRSGIPAGALWQVSLNGSTFGGSSNSTGKTLTFSVPNGSYTFRSSYDAWGSWVPGSNGSVTVAGVNASAAVSFSHYYAVSFTERGLPQGTYWGVTLGWRNYSSYSGGNSSALNVLAPNGTESFQVQQPPGYALTPANGSVNVSGANVSVYLSGRALPRYNVSFTESGLPSGSIWTVNLAGVQGSANTSSAKSINFSEPNGSYYYTVGLSGTYAPIPSLGYVTVNGTKASVSIRFVRAYVLTFRETGLAPGTRWSVTLTWTVANVSQNALGLDSTTSTIQFTETNGSYSVSIGLATGYAATASSSNVTIAGADVNVSVHFRLLPGYFAATFVAHSLPNSSTWYVYLYYSAPRSNLSDSTNGTNLSFAVTNGSYGYSVFVSGGASVRPSQGNFTVNGANVTVNLTFAPPPKVLVRFQESGLPSGYNFTVYVLYIGSNTSQSTGGSPGANVTFLLLNGSYAYRVASSGGYNPNPSSGTVLVSGANRTIVISVQFASAVTYTVSFAETGLPSGTSWTVDLGSSSSSSIGQNISFGVPNGSYAFSVRTGAHYTAAPSLGNVTVAGRGSNVSVTFRANQSTPSRYEVSFTESGLPSGANWSVDLNGSTNRSTGSSVGFSETNGSYAFNVSCGTGYNASPASGYANVSGAGVQISVKCTNGTGLLPLRFSARGLAPADRWSVTLTAVATGVRIEAAISLTKSAAEGSLITFGVSQGIYNYTARSVGYDVASGSVQVGSTPPSITVNFVSPITTTPANPLAGVPVGAVTAGGIALVAVLAVALLLNLRNRRSADREGGRLLVEGIGHSDWTRGVDGEPAIREHRR